MKKNKENRDLQCKVAVEITRKLINAKQKLDHFAKYVGVIC